MSSNVGFIGCGKMGGALAIAFVRAGVLSPDELHLFDKAAAAVSRVVKRVGGVVATDIGELCSRSDVVILAVKPQDMLATLETIQAAKKVAKAFVSIAAGVTLRTIGDVLGQGPHLIRTMPNRPAMVRAGVTGLMAAAGTPQPVVDMVVSLFKAAGEVVLVEREEDFDAVTALSGSGPAFVYRMIEGLIAGGREEGLSDTDARAFAVSTVKGAAALLLELGTSPAEERVAVSSPGGTTLAGLDVMESRGFFDTVVATVRAAASRSRELGRGGVTGSASS